MNEFELQILFKIREIFQNPFFDWLMPIISLFGDYGVFFIALSIILFFTKKYRKAGLTSALALLMGVIIVNVIIKNAVGRTRPYDLENGIVPLAKNLTNDYSFPSGHSLASFETGVGIFLNNKKLGIPVLVLGFLIAFSRLYLSVHYPTDVICGALLGTGFAFLAKYLVDIGMKKADQFILAKKGEKNESKSDKT